MRKFIDENINYIKVAGMIVFQLIPVIIIPMWIASQEFFIYLLSTSPYLVNILLFLVFFLLFAIIVLIRLHLASKYKMSLIDLLLHNQDVPLNSTARSIMLQKKEVNKNPIRTVTIEYSVHPESRVICT